MNSSRTAPAGHSRRLSPTLAALLVGLPLAAGILALFHFGPLHQTVAYRYVTHPPQWAAVTFFSCALGALVVKLWQNRTEAEICQLDVLPRWDGNPVPVSEAVNLLASLRKLPHRLQSTWLCRRLHAVLEFVCQRRTASDLDEHLRFLADTDAMNQENSYGLIRFITWAIPIIGFLGTVVGITGAIAGVSPETLQDSLSEVTGGLAEAFDSTALALGLTMLVMFLTFLVEKQEQGVLEVIDRLVDRHLAHRFQREGQAEGPFAEVVRQQTKALSEMVETLVSRQAELWAGVLKEPERRTAELHGRLQEGLVSALGTALDRALQTHAKRLTETERQTTDGAAQLLQHLAVVAGTIRETGQMQQAALIKVAEGVAGQAHVLGQLQQDAANVVHLQAVLHQNLAALAGASAFEQAVHTLTAAVHLLTARAAAQPAPQISRQSRAA